MLGSTEFSHLTKIREPLTGRLGRLRILPCLLYTSDAADERSSVDLGGRRIIKKKKQVYTMYARDARITDPPTIRLRKRRMKIETDAKDSYDDS